jgi:hypothetical protein
VLHSEVADAFEFFAREDLADRVVSTSSVICPAMVRVKLTGSSGPENPVSNRQLTRWIEHSQSSWSSS